YTQVNITQINVFSYVFCKRWSLIVARYNTLRPLFSEMISFLRIIVVYLEDPIPGYTIFRHEDRAVASHETRIRIFVLSTPEGSFLDSSFRKCLPVLLSIQIGR